MAGRSRGWEGRWVGWCVGSAVLADDGVDVLDGGDVGGWVVWKGEGGGAKIWVSWRTP